MKKVSVLERLPFIRLFRWLLPTNSACETQPVDAGLGRLLKILISREFEEWLEIDENLDTWENGESAEEPDSDVTADSDIEVEEQ